MARNRAAWCDDYLDRRRRTSGRAVLYAWLAIVLLVLANIGGFLFDKVVTIAP